MTFALLLVEDDADSRELLSSLLTSQGFAVTAAESSAAATSLVELHAFDVVLADFFVDDADVEASWQRLDRIRRLASPAPVGLLTAYPLHESLVRARELAFLLTKPCAAADLLGTLSDVLAIPQVSTTREAIVTRYFASLQRGEYDQLVALCSPAVIYHLPRAPLPMPERVVGRGQFRDFAQQTFDQFREPTFEIAGIRPLPSGALVRYSGSWLDQTDTRRSLPGSVMFSFVDNEISEIGVRCDLSVIG